MAFSISCGDGFNSSGERSGSSEAREFGCTCRLSKTSQLYSRVIAVLLRGEPIDGGLLYAIVLIGGYSN
jgi:hypothetical protein